VVRRCDAGNHCRVDVLRYHTIRVQPQLECAAMNDDEGSEMETIFLVCFLIVMAALGAFVTWFKFDGF
jgi:hypothetical protein